MYARYCGNFIHKNNENVHNNDVKVSADACFIQNIIVILQLKEERET